MSRPTRQPQPELQEIWQAQFDFGVISETVLTALLYGTGARGRALKERVDEYRTRKAIHHRERKDAHSA